MYLIKKKWQMIEKAIYVKNEQKVEWYELITDEEYENMKFVSIKIPMQHIVGETASQELLQTVQELKFLYSDIKTKPSPDKQRWVVSNINLADITSENSMMSLELYNTLKSIWCIIDQKIVELFEPWEVAQEETQAPESIATYTAAVSEEDARSQHTVDEIKEGLDYYQLPLSGIKEEISLRLYNHIHQ